MERSNTLGMLALCLGLGAGFVGVIAVLLPGIIATTPEPSLEFVEVLQQQLLAWIAAVGLGIGCVIAAVGAVLARPEPVPPQD